MFTKKLLRATKSAYDKDTDGIISGAVAGILACVPFVPAAILGAAAAADAVLLTGKVLSAIGTPRAPSPDTVRQQSIAQAIAEYNAIITSAQSIADEDMRDQIVGEAEIRLRERMDQML